VTDGPLEINHVHFLVLLLIGKSRDFSAHVVSRSVRHCRADGASFIIPDVFRERSLSGHVVVVETAAYHGRLLIDPSGDRPANRGR